MIDEHGIHTFHGPRMWLGTATALILIVFLCWGLISATQAYLQELNILASTSPEEAILKAGLALRLLGAIMGALAIGTGIYTARMSKRVIVSRQIPPPGVWVLGNPTVFFDEQAVLVGYLGYGLATLLSFVGVAVLVLVWHYVGLMTSGVVPA